MSALPLPPDAPEAQVRRLSLEMSRRLDGLLQGEHVRLGLGPGSEPAEPRLHTPGDDARRIDWAVTARTGETHVRTTTPDRELETTLLVDLTASMALGTRRSEKRALALAVAGALVHLTSAHGDRVGAVLLTGDGARRVPPRAGRNAALALRHLMLTTPRTESGRGADLAEALTEPARPPRRRGLVVLLSDLAEPGPSSGPPRWVRPLQLLAQRSDVVVCQVQDPLETELPAVGTLHVVDVETGRQMEVRTTRTVRERYREAAAARTEERRAAVLAAGAGHVLLRTDRDWLPELARHLSARRRALRGPAPGSLPRRPAAVPPGVPS
ncbi:DUF58 domain-containing protein [Blastococcus sp. TF02-09]|uniref:DUF58 domain-containing protein n=1 Tax=Blastococcus sp. TF02-09 TaxID=2250576 RepID=UPI000DEA6A2D|nr:DUF58 domain-containing protein [Blastococcus sp. TF02-9]RBY75369.1 DUF58 domain-containing protein [Blastococcus sp. TF02-9]